VHLTAQGQSPGASETTAAQNLLRDGWDPNEPGLSPATVSGGSFGKLFGTTVNGQVYAQPLVVDDTATTSSVLVATENDWVYSLDGETGAINWSLSLGQPWPASVNGCMDVSPNIGVTSTPVYDPSTKTLYLTAVLNDGPTLSQPDIYLYAIDEPTGTVKWRVPIQGTPVNNPTRPFDPQAERQRSSLLLLNGSVYMTFGSYCDLAPYVGYVAGVNTSTKAVSLWSDEAGLTDTQAGIWMGGSGLMSDGTGRIFAVTGNGVSPAPGAGTSPPAELGDSVVRLGVQPNGALAAQDFFSPANADQLDVTDMDLGSGGTVGLPFGTSANPDLLVNVGKDGRLFLLNRDALGGRGSDPTVLKDTNALSVNGPYGGVAGRPAAFAGDGGADYVYVAGNHDSMRALQFNPTTLALDDIADSTNVYGYTSGSPVVTSNGTDPSTAVVWDVYAANAQGAAGTLYAYAGLPQSGQPLTLLWSAPIGTAAKFTVPATANGRVYVGTRDGIVLGFGSPDSAPLTAPSTDFGQVAAGTHASTTVTVTAAATVTVNKIGITSPWASMPFAAGVPTMSGTNVNLPVTLNAGQTLSIPVTFSPGGPGGLTGSLVLATNTPNYSTVTFPLAGDGTRTGLYASPAALNFGTVPTGSYGTLHANIVNGGTVPEPVGAVTGATAPFGITGLSGIASIQPGASVPVTLTYTPTTATASTSVVTVGGAKLTLTGTAVNGRGALTASTQLVNFHGVPLGQFASQTVTLTNTGNLPVTITGFAAPSVPFGTPNPITTGLTIGGGYSITLPVTFTAQAPGTVTGTYQISFSDGHTPAQTLTVGTSGTGLAPASGDAVPSPGGGWTLNGSAQMSGTTLQLTPAAPLRKASAVYYQPLRSNGLVAQFTAQLSGGNGGDGMTFAMLNPGSSVSSLGLGTQSLGFGGLPGVAVVLGTHKDPGDPSGNFVGVATGLRKFQFVWAATSTKVPNLRSGTHRIGVAVAAGKISVWVDGVRYLNVAVTLPGIVMPAFTAATGTLDDVHAVSAVRVWSGTAAVPPPGGGWSYNGSAQMSGADTALTLAAANQAGSVVYPRLVTTNGLHARFSIQIGGGTGGQGMTFALLSRPVAATALGKPGKGLGLAGLTGVAVSFGTFANGNPTPNFVAITTSAGGTLTYTQNAVLIGQLRSGTHDVSVIVQGNVLIVYLDGQQVLAQAEPGLPATAALAYTGGTDTATDVHLLRNAAISATSLG
jgi:hypothetical protein